MIKLCFSLRHFENHSSEEKTIVYFRGWQTVAHGPNPTYCLFCVSPELRTVLDFKIILKIKRRILFHGMLKLYKIQISISINKVLLEHCHTHSFPYCLLLFCVTVTELSSWKRNFITSKS